MRLLVLGGTAWIGREVAAQVVAAGHEVVCVARGTAGEVAAGAHLVVADRDADHALAPVAGEEWDAVVDVARQPGHVRRAARDLSGSAAHYVLVSSISAYRPVSGPGLDESAPLREALASDVMGSMEEYGEAKVACEDAVRAAFADRSTVARVGLIGGPGDWSDRTTYWPARFARAATEGGPVLVPDEPDLPTSVIDGRDLAAWLLHCATERVGGLYNATGPVLPLTEHLGTAAAVAGYDGPSVAVPPDWLASQGVENWSGPRSLPLWLTGEDRWLTAFSSDRAVAAGLITRPLADTLADALVWRATEDRPWASGLTADEESGLLAAVP